jgi:DNA-binding LytR/AlgR family response regulator
MLNCYIVDDEQHAIDVLAKYIARTPGLVLSGSNTDPINGLTVVRAIQPDIIFLDIDMPGLSGIEFLHLLYEKSGVVFTTAMPQYAVEAYLHNLSDYLLKPITYERFLNCILRQRDRVPSADNDHFFVRCELKSKIVRINCSDVIYVESLNNYVMIHYNDEKTIAYITMKEVLNFLPGRNFSRIHKSFIINNNKISSITGNQVFLTGKKDAITIGQTYREEFLNKIGERTLRRS